MSGESLLYSRQEGRIRKEGLYKEDNGAKGNPFEMGRSLSPLSLLQVYTVITSQTSQGLYLRQAAFLQRLHSTQSISPLNYKF